MAWIELHQTLPKNKKTMKFKRALKIKTPAAIGHLCLLWLWAIDSADDGDISEFTAEDIAEVCEWTKNADMFLSALKDAGFVTEDMKIHDWDDYIGMLIAKREVKKEQARTRQKRYRDKQKNMRNGDAEVNQDVTHDNAPVTRDNSVSNAPIPYRTVTVPNRTVISSSCCNSENACGNGNGDGDGDNLPKQDEDDFDETKLECYGPCYQKVMLSQKQVDDLLERMSIDEFNFYLEKLDCFIHDKNAKVKNHYETMLNWCMKDRLCKS